MKSSVNIKMYLICFVAINLVLTAIIQDVRAVRSASPIPPKRCVQRDGLTFNGVGLWTKLPTVLECYGQPLRIERISGTNRDRVYATYYYKDIKLLIFNSIVWQIGVLTAEISTKSGIRLLNDFSAVENILGVKLRNTTTEQNKTEKYKAPICPPDSPEVEEYVILGFDNENRLTEFIVEGVFP
jgi:hypothetical protein